MQVLRNAELPQSGIPGITHTTLAGCANGLTGLSLWRQRMMPGSATPPHRHDCEEVVLVLAGTGEVHFEGKVVPFGPDTTLVIPPDVDHQIFATGSEPLETVAAFSRTPVGVTTAKGDVIPLPWAS
jgi:mannose-6-phosphate isomerase-like protein (cupin superfamily)